MMKTLNTGLFRFPVTLLLLLLAGVVTQGQAGNTSSQKVAFSLTGKYEGTAKGPNGDVQMTLDLVDEAGKFSGSVTTAKATYKVVGGQMADGVLTLDAEGNGSKGRFTLQLKDEQLVGDFSADNAKGHCEFKR